MSNVKSTIEVSALLAAALAAGQTTVDLDAAPPALSGRIAPPATDGASWLQNERIGAGRTGYLQWTPEQLADKMNEFHDHEFDARFSEIPNLSLELLILAGILHPTAQLGQAEQDVSRFRGKTIDDIFTIATSGGDAHIFGQG